MSNKSGSSRQSKKNRNLARRLGYKGTKAARDAGVDLPTRDEAEKRATDDTGSKLPHRGKKGNE